MIFSLEYLRQELQPPPFLVAPQLSAGSLNAILKMEVHNPSILNKKS